MRLLTNLLFLSLPLFGGQSLVPAGTATASLPWSGAADWRVECMLDVPDTPQALNSRPYQMAGLGLNNRWVGDYELEAYNERASGGSGQIRIQLSEFPVVDIGGSDYRRAYIRHQWDHSALTLTSEAWDYYGVRRVNVSHTAASFSGSDTGAQVGYSGGPRVAFCRIHTSLVPLNSRPPTTFNNTDRLAEWKLDGDLLDSLGNYDLSGGGSHSYVTTTGQGAYAFVKTYDSPSWSDWVSLRAGVVNQLDGSDSYSQADASADVTYFWTQASGASSLKFNNRTLSQPEVSNIIFGGYTVRLVVTSVADGSTNLEDLTIGAVATDSNGIVIQSDPNADILFGPMIAFGRNPWGRFDERALKGVQEQPEYFINSNYPPTPDSPSWNTKAQGTVAFKKNLTGGTSTTITGNISATDLSIPIAEAANLPSLQSLPTWLILQFGSTYELIRVTATTATSGAATLTVPFGGRGLGAWATFYTLSGPTAFSSGAAIREMRLSGTSTLFATDPNRPLCPGGVPGPPGAVVYSDGSVEVTAGSNIVTGTMGDEPTWNSANGVFGGDSMFIRIEATHSGGTPFVWWSQITTVDSATQLTLARSLPTGTDSGPFSYVITDSPSMYLALNMTQTDGRENAYIFNILGCESETAAFILDFYENVSMPSTSSGKQFSTYTSYGTQSAFGPNFYGSGLALRAFYLRSGYTPALTAANGMDNWWIRNPELTAGSGIILLQGGGVIGGIACLVLGQCDNLDWKDVRKFVTRGDIGASGCNDTDSRDGGYATSWLTLGALFDPDNTERSGWLTNLASVYTRANNCKGSDNSWANGFYYNTFGTSISFTEGSAVGTGTGISSSICRGNASGTATVTNGSATVSIGGGDSGTFTNPTHKSIILTGIVDGLTKSLWFNYSYSSGTSISLSGLWPGDSGQVTWLIESHPSSAKTMTTWGTSNNDPNLAYNYGCTWDSSTQITLHRAWRGATGTYSNYDGNLAGKGQQPYMLGITMNQFKWAAQITENPTLASNFEALIPLAGTWERTVGYDPIAKAMNYGNIFEACEPHRTPAGSFDYVFDSCQHGDASSGIISGRLLTPETTSAITGLYETQTNQTNLDWGDEAYGYVWCATGYDVNAPGGCDSSSVGNNISAWNFNDTGLSGTKWVGFGWGMGMGHQWPAVRLGGIPAAQTRTNTFGFTLPSGGASARFTITYPSGKVETTTCNTSPCGITSDARQGSQYLYYIEYLDGGANVIARSDTQSFTVK